MIKKEVKKIKRKKQKKHLRIRILLGLVNALHSLILVQTHTRLMIHHQMDLFVHIMLMELYMRDKWIQKEKGTVGVVY